MLAVQEGEQHFQLIKLAIQLQVITSGPKKHNSRVILDGLEELAPVAIEHNLGVMVMVGGRKMKRKRDTTTTTLWTKSSPPSGG